MIHLDSKLSEESEHRLTWIEMGEGDVGMHITSFEKKHRTVTIAFKDIGKKMEINKKHDSPFKDLEEMKPPVLITFTKVESIESMIAQLEDLKEILELENGESLK